ncbi:MAG TPA: M20 family metallopeptidase [Pyrinomonadaceae bacterium]|nr:M20 family metallopeptidase [Pyrinomonadaceae bacterium]
MEPSKILNYFEKRTGSIVESIRSLVDIESPSHDAEASRRVVDAVEGMARATGVAINVERFDVADGTHLLVTAFDDQPEFTVLLGHLDTVHPVGTAKKNPTRIEGDRLYGCGAFDMKANVAVALGVLRYFAETARRPTTEIRMLLSCDEEVGSHSGREYVDRFLTGAKQCLVMEPSADGKVKTGRKGTGMFQLAAHGVPAHAGLEPEKGANAVAELARQVDKIHAIARPEIGTTVNVTTFRGGTTLNVIPDHAICDIDVRYSIAREAERVVEELNSLGSTDERVRLELTGAINRPPLERTDAVVTLYRHARDLAASFDYELGETQVGGGSDGNFVAALGVPVLDGLGLAGAGAHTLDEYVLVSDIPNRATLLTLLLTS